MPYSSYDDIVNLVGTEELARLTGGSTVDYDKLDKTISNADNLINAYLIGRFDITDEDEIPSVINMLSAELTVVNLFENYNNFGEIPNMIIRRKRNAMKIIQDITNGKINLNYHQQSLSVISLTNKF